MTTIRDLLNDLINEVQTNMEKGELDYERKRDLLDEYTQTIKERIVG